jgi:large subunit ribosomal protein L3
MLNTFLGKKIRQTQKYDENGTRFPVTEISVTPGVIVQIKTLKNDGYWAIQVGFENRQTKNITKPLLGHFKKTGQGKFLPRFLREIKLPDSDVKDGNLTYKVGDLINCETVLKIGDIVDVVGVSKGKGFQGGVKRHHFAGGSRTHGQSDRERAPGSIGQTTTPGRVYKGKRMAGRMGGEQATISRLKIVDLDTQNHILKVSGLIPGRINNLVMINKH